MHVKVIRAKSTTGKTLEYVRLVESFREDGQVKHRTIVNLGRRDLLAPHLDRLIEVLRPDSPPPAFASEPQAVAAWDWGPVLVAQHLWRELGLDRIVDRLGRRSRRDGTTLSDRAFVLVANRLCTPCSEHGLARWLETDFVCDRVGRRWVPQWRDDDERRRSKAPRVRVQSRQLQTWYRTLDRLYQAQADIERDLFLRLRDLFSLKVDMVLYDLTSTYFEGRGPTSARHGFSRDKRPRNRQVLVGCVMVDGWPIATHVFEGNRRDSTTVQEVLEDVDQRFGLRRVVLVGDRGMVTSTNLQHLRDTGHGYIVGRQRRRSPEVFGYVEAANANQDAWLDCPVGITAQEKASSPCTRVQEVPSEQPGVRVFVVHSDERHDYERGEREKVMERTRTDLQALVERVHSGRLNAPEKIGAAAERILKRHHGYRYFQWELDDGAFRFFEHPDNLPRELAYEGKYVIQTEEPDLDPVQAVELYKQLSEVERAFRNLKDVIDLRPVFHQTDERVEAHIFVAALAFLLHRAIEQKLKAAGLDLSATQALQALRTVRLVDIDLGNGTTKRSVTRGSRRAAAILTALGITNLDPPSPTQNDTEIRV